MTMKKLGSALAALFAFALLSVGSAHADTAVDGTMFGSKTVQIGNKGSFTQLLTLPAGKEVTATTDGDKQTDVHLFVYDSAEGKLGQDVSPGPQCLVKFTPVKAGTYKFVVKNEGPGANNVTLKVTIAN